MTSTIRREFRQQEVIVATEAARSAHALSRSLVANLIRRARLARRCYARAQTERWPAEALWVAQGACTEATDAAEAARRLLYAGALA